MGLSKTVLSLAFIPLALPFAYGGIHGEDNRRDLYEVTEGHLIQLARATAVHFRSSAIDLDPATGEYVTNPISLDRQVRNQGHELCRGLKFGHQYVGGKCTATLVGPDLLLTAGHCIDEESCESAFYAFGYHATDAKDPGRSRFSPEQVYRCKSIIQRSHLPSPHVTEVPDFAVVRLDREVAGRRPIEIDRRPGGPEIEEPLSAASFPLGMPLKLHQGKVTHFVPGRIVSGLDVFRGSSGASVLSERSGKIVGIVSESESPAYFFHGYPGGPYMADGCIEPTYFPADAPGIDSLTPAASFERFIPSSSIRSTH